MTQRSALKKLVRARQAKTNESYTTALRHVRSQASTANNLETASINDVVLGTTEPDDVAELLAQLRASPFAIQVGRIPAVGRSATYAVAMAQAHELRVNPKFYAESGGVGMTISELQLERLAKAGAARDTEIQVIRSFHAEHGSTFSVRCKGCDRWIWCGKKEREGACVCGHAYRIVFDLNEAYHWTQRRGMCCLDCGTPFKMARTAEGRSPWRPVNSGQSRCHQCQLLVLDEHIAVRAAVTDLLDVDGGSSVVVYIQIRFEFERRRLTWFPDIIKEDHPAERLAVAERVMQEMGRQVIEPLLAQMDGETYRVNLVSRACEVVRTAVEREAGAWSHIVEIAAVEDGRRHG